MVLPAYATKKRNGDGLSPATQNKPRRLTKRSP
jgi:hypothetical protein